MKNSQGDFQVLIHLIIRRQCLHAANTEKSAPKRKTSGILGIQEGKKKNWTNVKTTPNMDRVMGTWFELLNKRHMIKNTELEFEHQKLPSFSSWHDVLNITTNAIDLHITFEIQVAVNIRARNNNTKC